MTGTPRTISVLNTQVQDLVATLKARTGDGKINLVTAPEYGADPTGTSDSTAAFAAALAGPSTAVVPPGIYRISNLAIPSGGCLVGQSAIGYGWGSGPNNATVLVALDGTAKRVINVDGATNVLIAGLQIDCDPARSETRNANCDGISAGSKVMTLRDITVQFGRYGLGGAVSTGTNNSNTSQISIDNCQFFGCVTGIGDIVDAWLTNCYLSYCINGAYFTSQSGGITMVGSRIEWNIADGLHIENASDIIVTGSFFDRNYVSAVYLDGTYKALFSGCEFKRNGRNLDANSCHVRLNSAAEVTFSGCSSRPGRDDDGTGNNAPTIWVRESGTSWKISFVGNDLNGVSGQLPMTLSQFWVGNIPNYYTFTNNTGLLMDERSGYRPMTVSGFIYHQFSEANIGANSTENIQIIHDPIPAYHGITHKIRVTSRNQSTGIMYSSEFNYMIQREGGTPTITQSAATATIGVAGYIAFGSGTVKLQWTNIASDASTYTLSVINTSTTDINYVTVQIF